MKYDHFEDTGLFYADRRMKDGHLVLSMNSGLVYDIKDVCNVKIIKRVSDAFFAIAQEESAKGSSCIHEQRSIFRDELTNNFLWEL